MAHDIKSNVKYPRAHKKMPGLGAGEREQAQPGGETGGRRAQTAGTEGAGDHQAQEAVPREAGRGDAAAARSRRAPTISRVSSPGDEGGV